MIKRDVIEPFTEWSVACPGCQFAASGMTMEQAVNFAWAHTVDGHLPRISGYRNSNVQVGGGSRPARDVPVWAMDLAMERVAGIADRRRSLLDRLASPA